MKIETIKLGFCPQCNCKIADFDEKGTASQNNLYDLFWVLYDDNSDASFAICKNCLPKLAIEDVKKIQQRQRYTWGVEIIDTPLSFKAFCMQLNWYISCGVLLEVVKFSKTKEELKND